MSVRLDGSAYLTLTPSPIVAAPFSVGFWVRPDDFSGFGDMLSISNDGSHYWDVYWDGGASSFVFDVAGTGGNGSPSVTTNNLPGWYYVLLREIAIGSRRMSVLRPDGAVVHTANTQVTVPASIARMQIGSWLSGGGANMTGAMAHLWYAAGDVMAADVQTPDWMARRFAVEGPLWNSYMLPRLVEYRTLLAGIPGGMADEVYCRSFQNWKPTGSPTIGAQPVMAFRSSASVGADTRLGLV